MVETKPVGCGIGSRLNDALLEVIGGLVGLGSGEAVGVGALTAGDVVGVGVLAASMGDDVAVGDPAVHPLIASRTAAARRRERRACLALDRITNGAYVLHLRRDCGRTAQCCRGRVPLALNLLCALPLGPASPVA